MALVLTVPWFFTNFDNKMVWGFPLWALYSISMSVLYAMLIAILIGRYWDISAGKDENEEDL